MLTGQSTRRWTLRASILALGCALAVATVAWAAPGPPPPPGPPSLLHVLPQILDQMNLTDDQQAAIGRILDTQRQAADAQRPQMMAAHKALHDQIVSATFDEAAIRQAAGAVATLEAERAVADAALLRDIRAQLTAEQQAQLQGFLESHGPGQGGPGGPGVRGRPGGPTGPRGSGYGQPRNGS